VWQSFFRGQLTLSLVIGGVTLVVGLAIGLPSALALAIIAGVMEAVPTLGPILAAIPAVILALTQGSSVLPVDNVTFAIITLAAYILIQQAENMLIVPRIMGNALELHPMVVLVGVVIGASFAGILGIFLAAPTLATLKVLLM
jgi:predicted PurR-regulated permease PerM